MACPCSKGKLASVRSARGKQFVYDFYAPGAEIPKVFTNPIDARRAVRQAGGGAVRRREVDTRPAA